MSPTSRTTQLRPTSARRSAAFTLIELLTSIGIIAFILSIAILAVAPALRVTGTRDAARRLRAMIDTARIKAVQQRRAVRFEAQHMRINDVPTYKVPEVWAASPNASDTVYQWYTLPDFVTVRVNCQDPSAVFATELDRFSITFGADGSVRSYNVNGAANTTLPTPTARMLLCLYTTREASDAEVNLSACYIEITPLTGVVRSYGTDEAAAGDRPKQ
jgi:Tfp pilus assembly protein FimT